MALYKVAVTLPSIAGKTIGTNRDDYLNLIFWTSAGSTFNARTNSLGLQTITLDLFGVHLRPGDLPLAVADNYRPPSVADTLLRCQRYFEQAQVTVQSGGAGSFIDVYAFKVSKRALPTIATVTAGTGVNASFTAFNAPTTEAVGIQAFASASGGSLQNLVFSASARL